MNTETSKVILQLLVLLRKRYHVVFYSIFSLTLSSFKVMPSINSNNDLLFSIIPGTSFNYQIEESSVVKTQLGERLHTSTTIDASDEKISLAFIFPIESGKNYNGIVKIDSYIFKDKSNQDPNSNLSSEDTIPSPFLRSLKAVNGSQFNINFDKFGRVLNIGGYVEFRKNFDEVFETELKNTKIEDRPAFTNSGEVFFREHYFSNLFEKITNILPDTEVTIGSKWQKLESKDIAGGKFVRTSYYCYKIHDGIAFIKSYAELDEPMAAPKQSDHITGIEEGKIELDVNTGMLISSEKRLVMQGHTYIGQSKFSITKESTKIIKRINVSPDEMPAENNSVFSGLGSAIKEVPIKEGTNQIRLGYEFYGEPDQLTIEDQNGTVIITTEMKSTTNEQSITIPTTNIKMLIIKLTSKSGASRWRIKIDY